MKWYIQLSAIPLMFMVQTAAYAAATSALPESRILTFDDYALTNNGAPPTWVHEGPPIAGLNSSKALLPGTNHYHRTGWTIIAARTGSSAYLSSARSIPPRSPASTPVYPVTASNLAANLQNDLSAKIESPVFAEGIGTLYFEAINQLVAYPTQISVEIATNMVDVETGDLIGTVLPPSTDNLSYVWETLNVIELNAATSNDFTRYVRKLNVRYPIRMRILRTGTNYVGLVKDSAFSVIDNIRVSLPPSDVVVYKAECPFEPGYPAVSDDIRIRCYVDNVDMNAPTSSRTVDVCYRWRYLDQASSDWATVSMTLAGAGDGQGNGERFEATLPAQAQAGDLEYYFVCSFDGYCYQSPDYTDSGYAGYPSESFSPRTLRGGAAEPGGREFYTRLRPFKSPYGALHVVADQLPQPVEMALVGDDEWRGMVPVRAAAVTNLSWYFKGAGAYVQGADAFAIDTSCWVAPAQAGVERLPSGGVCVPTNETARSTVAVPDGGYVQMTLNTRTLECSVRRAEYQNFNAWPAPADTFTDGNSQGPRLRFLNTFDGWQADMDQTFQENFIAYGCATNVYYRDPFLTPQQWVAGGAAYVMERNEADYPNKPAGVLGFRNLSMRLKGGDAALGLGYVYSTVASRPDGLKQIAFKCRLGQTASNYDIAFNRTEFLKTNYLVRVTAQALSALSPEQPSLSLVAYLRDPGNFYEYRITQIPDTMGVFINRDKRVMHQLFKWTDGVPVLKIETKPEADVMLAIATTMEVSLYNETASVTRIKCRYGTADTLDFTDASAPIQGGTYGFLSAECRASFSAVYTQPTVTGAVAIEPSRQVLSPDNSANFDAQKLNWYTPAGRFQVTRTVAPYGIYSVLPTQKLGVYLQESEYGSTAEAALPGSPLWKKVQEVTVPGFGYASVAIPVNTWKSHFVMLQVMGGSADVAVDELAVSSWHGRRSSDSGLGNAADWLATEAWSVQGGPVSPVFPGSAGLNEGRLAGAFNTTDPNPMTSVQLTTRYANLTTGFPEAATYVYSGDIYLNGSTYTFGENFDDNVLLTINGQVILRDMRWNVPTTGVLSLPAGWYGFELRVGNGIAMAGPCSGVGLGGYGVAYSLNGGTTWLPLTDPGNGSLLVPDLAGTVQVVQLDHSRADPAREQAIRSPLIETGMGLMEFDYRVLRAPAKLTVQYALKRDPSAWVDVQSLVCDATSGWTHATAYLGKDESGYLRVLSERGGGHTNALVEINNALIRDEPYVDETMWTAYNAKITDTDLTRVALDASEACFLNNSQTLDADPIQDRFEPFVQTPALPAGLGELTFHARAYSNSQPATVYVYATTNGWGAAAAQWFEIARFDNITNAFYQPYAFRPDGETAKNYDALRLMTATSAGARRVCLDEIAVSESLIPEVVIGAQSKTLTTPVPVPYAWLELYPTLVASRGGDYEAAAWLDLDGDGLKTWEEYVAGSVPTNSASVFMTLIAISNGAPRVTWTPDLGAARVYTVEGMTNLTDGVWGPTNAGSRLFRAKVWMP